MKITGHWHFALHNADGTLADEWERDNFLTELGEAHIAARVALSPPSAMTHMAVGTGTGQTAASTALATEIARVALDSTYPLLGTGGNDNQITWQATFAAGTGTGTLTEFAVFSASSAGTMLNYVTGETKIKGASQSLIVTLTMRFGVS
jgi:hypothetical protein